MRALYCDCFSGVSGDMLLGAMVDAGLPLATLHGELSKLGLAEYSQVKVDEVNKQGMRAALLRFELNGDDEEHHHHHGQDHVHCRHLSDITTLIQTSDLSERVKQTSVRVFKRLAEAEARVHGTPLEEIHFHEVGAVDSILDICGIMIGLDYFQIDRVFSAPLPVGGGTVQTSHGVLPVPAPATLALMQMVSAPTVPSSAQVEQVTPTGMAILAEFADFARPEMSIEQVGVGAGVSDLPWANILRVVIGDLTGRQSTHVVIETNLDDMTPQLLGNLMPKLLDAGALDVYFTAIQMKKNRPGTQLSVIACQADETRLADMLLRETSTFGVRIHPVHRMEAERTVREVQTSLGIIRVKDKILDGRVVHSYPEYADCARIAAEKDIPLQRVMNVIISQLPTPE